MISLELVRQGVMEAFKGAHEANYPATLVNYPNLVVVDLDKQRAPFVSMSLDLTGIEQSAIGERDIIVPGKLMVHFYYRMGTGTSEATEYTDMLNKNLGLNQIGALQFGFSKPMSIQSFPAWEGTLNVIPFNVVKALSC